MVGDGGRTDESVCCNRLSSLVRALTSSYPAGLVRALTSSYSAAGTHRLLAPTCTCSDAAGLATPREDRRQRGTRRDADTQAASSRPTRRRRVEQQRQRRLRGSAELGQAGEEEDEEENDCRILDLDLLAYRTTRSQGRGGGGGGASSVVHVIDVSTSDDVGAGTSAGTRSRISGEPAAERAGGASKRNAATDNAAVQAARTRPSAAHDPLGETMDQDAAPSFGREGAKSEQPDCSLRAQLSDCSPKSAQLDRSLSSQKLEQSDGDSQQCNNQKAVQHDTSEEDTAERQPGAEENKHKGAASVAAAPPCAAARAAASSASMAAWGSEAKRALALSSEATSTRSDAPALPSGRPAHSMTSVPAYILRRTRGLESS